MLLRDPIQFLKGVGPRRAPLLNALGLHVVEDLLFYFPKQHEDRRQLVAIRKLAPDVVQTTRGKVVSVSEKMLKKRLTLLTVTISDGTGVLVLPFFNQKFLKRQFVVGDEYIMTGKVVYKFGLQMQNPVLEKLSDNDEDNMLNTGRIVPIYPLTEGLSQRAMRRMIKNACDAALAQIEELLPQSLVEEHRLLDRVLAIKEIHFPSSMEKLEEARRRLIFEEFFMLQLALAVRRQRLHERDKHALSCKDDAGLVKTFWNNLPFPLTGAQKRVISEIKADMAGTHGMSRLLQGDVGSGKTIVAVHAMLLCIQNGYQVAFMAPTEILAAQHFQVLQGYIDIFQVKASLLVGSMSKKERTAVLDDVRSGECSIVVGTHALIEDDVIFQKLGLVIVDEQHKFGVMQKSLLQDKGESPHVLVMTATPIPRTLAMTVYGDLDVSVIDELPQGRKSIKTYWVGENKRADLYDFVRKQVAQGRQVYFVYPLVEKSEKLDLKAVEEHYEQLRTDIFPDLRIGMVHGRMKARDKDDVMTLFKNKQLDILVATTVIEVGINVPNATIMVIENAVRFGLAQLHQLRGRVGRGEAQSYCILMGHAGTEEARKRMDIMTETTDGFRIAEVDLEMRGPGEFFGLRQHGLPELRIGSLVTDVRVMEEARRAAVALFQSPSQRIAAKALLHVVQSKYGEKAAVATVA